MVSISFGPNDAFEVTMSLSSNSAFSFVEIIWWSQKVGNRAALNLPLHTNQGRRQPKPAMGVEPITPALRMRCSAN